MGISSNYFFSSPKFDFSKANSYKKELIYIKKPRTDGTKEEYIPCLFIMEYDLSPNFLIYFHGNAEHIFMNELFGFHFAREFKINVIMVEYKGYSIYKGKPDPNSILEDSETVCNFIKENFKSKDLKIIACGRSLGSSPAIYLASKQLVDALITISAFESIKNIGSQFYIGILFPDIFKSIDYISKVKCPALFIHGEKDLLISYKQSKDLYEKCSTNKDEKDFILRPSMTHNEVDFKEDIISPIKNFFDKLNKMNINVTSKLKNILNPKDKNFKKMFETPEYIQQFIEEKMFQISKFTKINEKDINCSDDTLILAMTDEFYIYSIKNIIYIYKFDSQLYEIIEKENENEIIIYLFRISDNKFLYLTNKGSLKIYCFNIYECTFINCLTLNSPRKVISSCENDMVYVLGNDIRKLKIEDKIIEKEIIQSDIIIIQISFISDILEIKKDIIILSSSEILYSMNNENKKIEKFSQKISPIDKNNLYKLNDNEFLIIEKSKIKLFSLENDIYIELKQTFDLDPFHLLYFINVEKIIIRYEITKHYLRQIYLLNQKVFEEDSLRILEIPNEIKQIELMKNKKYFLVLIEKFESILLKKNINYYIEIWGRKISDNNNSNCAII